MSDRPIPTLTETVKGNVEFTFYRDKQLYYKATSNGLIFPVPIEDAGTAVFAATDKAIFFMRWIRKHIEELKKEANN